jgi:hypothetical protein
MLLLALALSCTPAPETLPPLTDLDRFPPDFVALEMRGYWRDRLTLLRNRADTELHHEQWYTAAMAEARWRFNAWDLLCDAQTDYGTDYRRQKLEALRDQLGIEAYLAGWMPW